MCETIKPTIDIKLTSTIVDLFENADKADSDRSRPYAHNRCTQDTSEFYCMICLDELKCDSLSLVSCQHKVCNTCWKDLIKHGNDNVTAGRIKCPGEGCDSYFISNRDCAHLFAYNDLTTKRSL
mmetsp:Transcript_7238/g.13744  ORF Transcript_7238/g.13744 Transcript_7238/m.13744 type:complete len:124 (-) Transcript_7238:3449-3820(-)